MKFNLLPVSLLATLAAAHPSTKNSTAAITHPGTNTSTTSPAANPGRAIVQNNCAEPIYLWSVGSGVSVEIPIPDGAHYSETFRHDQKTGGVSLKVTTVAHGLYSSAPQTVFAYNVVGESVWYDLSDVFGDPFKGSSVTLLPSEPVIRWSDGVPPVGSMVRVVGVDQDLRLTFC
ncbi:Bys1 family protein [Aspergillus campestris IBT 28561]|uniref:Bys1 family protein n=1 Tax=Aspergillus campestris (strain IBT 28561) TaxID=1392248 RepID=A0A2I1D0B5_ASPC2|nr:Bys1 family protein [Aspergillus campestris IBT 28561]PKY03314.1 Bys1 family protein [Aspergillus campestris IBT 28561]